MFFNATKIKLNNSILFWFMDILKTIYVPTKPIKYRAWFGLPPMTPKDCGKVKHIWNKSIINLRQIITIESTFTLIITLYYCKNFMTS